MGPAGSRHDDAMTATKKDLYAALDAAVALRGRHSAAQVER